MLASIAYITTQWCTQSHLNTENYEKAMNGLRRTRRFKRYTVWIVSVPGWVIGSLMKIWGMLFSRTQRHEGVSRRIRWSGPRSKRRRSVGALVEEAVSQNFSNRGSLSASWVDVRSAQPSRVNSLHRMCAHEECERQGRASKDRGVRVKMNELSRS